MGRTGNDNDKDSSVGQLVLETVTDDCRTVCLYRAGDGEDHRKRLRDKINSKLKYRVAHGKDVKALERRVVELEAAIFMVVTKSRAMTTKDIEYLKKLLRPSKEST